MPFYPFRYYEGKDCEVAMENTVTVAKGDALDDSDDDGLFGLATSSSDFVPYVAMETVTTTSAGQKIKAIRTWGVQFLADTTNNTAATDRNLTADLTDEDEVNNGASSNDVFYIEETVGAAADKKVLGTFLPFKATA